MQDKVPAALWRQLAASAALDEALEWLSKSYIDEFDELVTDDMAFAVKAAHLQGARGAIYDLRSFIEGRIDDIEAEEREASARDREESQDTET